MLSKIKEKKSAVLITSNIGGKVTVSGNNTYAQSYFDKSGIINVAKDIEGNKEVNMEQINKWNPDAIFVFLGTPAKAFLNNKIQGQDWSFIKAFKNKEIYDIPKGIYSWGAPSADSPLTPLWIISKAYPSLIKGEEFNLYLKEYYKGFYNIDLKEETINNILNPNKGKGI